MKHLFKIGILVVFVLIFVSNSFADDVIISPPIWLSEPDPQGRCIITSLYTRNTTVGIAIQVCAASGECFPHFPTFDYVYPGTIAFKDFNASRESYWYCKFTVPQKNKVRASICSNVGCMDAK
jgi:hypothetical protein